MASKEPDFEPSFLFLGAVADQAAVGRLKHSGLLYRQKMLDSLPENWYRIHKIMQTPTLVAVLAKLSANTCELLISERYSEPATLIMESLQKLPHAIFVHEGVLDENANIRRGGTVEPIQVSPGEPIQTPSESEWEEDLSFFMDKSYFRTLSPEDLEKFRKVVNEYELNLVPYRTNAQLSMLASTFLERHDHKLLFRIYVPSGRLWASEASKLLSLFRSWLAQVKGQRIRHGGYTTSGGEVHEFYGEESLGVNGLTEELRSFSDFLDLCIHDPAAAEQILENQNVDRVRAANIITRYARDARRINIDLRQERESRLLAIRHRLENELEESVSDGLSVADQMLPAATKSAAILAVETANLAAAEGRLPITINQQIFHSVQGIVAQEVTGNARLGADAAQLLELISRFGGADSAELESAVHEMEDAEAQAEDRLTAGQRLKGFLFKIGEKVSDAGIAMLQKYIETKMGL